MISINEDKTIRREAAELRKFMILSRLCCVKLEKKKLLEVKKVKDTGEHILIEVSIEV